MRQTEAVTLLFSLLLLLVGWLLGKGFRLTFVDRLAVLYEFPCRNLAIAILVGVNVLGRPDLVRFATAVFLIHAVLLLGLTYGLGWWLARTSSGPHRTLPT